MVTIPAPQNPGGAPGSVRTQIAPREYERSFQRIAADTSAEGQQIAQFGRALGQFGQQLGEVRKDNALREAEVEFMKFEKELLDPQTGIFTRRQGNTAGMADEVEGRFGQFREGLLERYGSTLSASGRQALEQYLDGAGTRVWKRAASHEMSESMQYRDTLRRATIEGQVDRAALLYDQPDEVAASFFSIQTLAGDLADDQGLSGEARTQFVQEYTHDAAMSIAAEMVNRGRVQEAERFLETAIEEGNADPTEAANLLGRVRTAAAEERGRQTGRLAFGAVAGPPGSTENGQPTVETILPALFAQESGYGAGRSMEDAVTIQSSAGAYGISQMMPGSARDPGFGVRPYAYADGVPPGTPTDVVAREQMRFGRDYLNAMLKRYDGNMELALYAYNWGPGNVDSWRKTGTGVNGQPMPQETKDYAPAVLGRAGYSLKVDPETGTRIESTMTPWERVQQISDPIERAAAIAEWERLEGEEHKRHTRQQTQVRDALFADIDEAVANGEAYDLDAVLAQPGVRSTLGDNVSAVRDYYNKRTSGKDVETQPQDYQRLQLMSETDPSGFASLDLQEYRGVLSPSDLKGFIDKQAAILGDSELPVTISDLRGNVSPLTSGMDPEDRGVLESRMIDWTTAFTAREGKPPTAMQQYAHAEMLMQSNQVAQFNQPGVGNFTRFGEADLLDTLQKADELGLDSLLGTELELNVTMASGDTVPTRVSEAEIRELIASYTQSVGRAPKPSQVLQMLMITKSDLP